ncbi:hypothetical protein, partial [Nocardia wallacei]|uniref:hypothetical protein n=1 Tax=Nocardia wallacei TaxID=480035 RepID=UPI002453CECE
MIDALRRLGSTPHLERVLPEALAGRDIDVRDIDVMAFAVTRNLLRHAVQCWNRHAHPWGGGGGRGGGRRGGGGGGGGGAGGEGWAGGMGGRG